MKTWLWRSMGAVLVFQLGSWAVAAPMKEEATYLLPLNCSELLPDNTPFLSYFESVGRGQVLNDKALSQKIFRILALRDKLNQEQTLFEGLNPIDTVIRRTLCYYRQQKDALQPVPYFDPKILGFLKENMRELEKKVESVIMECQYQSLNKEKLAQKAKQNQALVDNLRKQAEKSADQTFDKLSREAARKVRIN